MVPSQGPGSATTASPKTQACGSASRCDRQAVLLQSRSVVEGAREVQVGGAGPRDHLAPVHTALQAVQEAQEPAGRTPRAAGTEGRDFDKLSVQEGDTGGSGSAGGTGACTWMGTVQCAP